MAENVEIPRNTAPVSFKNLCASIFPAFFVIIVSINILYPLPSGPPDNGDFNRIFDSFSSGPVGHDYWPSIEDQGAYQKRFFNYYHRFWRFDGGKGFGYLSSSRLFFWPGRIINLTPGTFDLAWNAFLQTLFLGCILYLVVKSIKGTAASFSLGGLVFIFADAHISGYLNSFYEESGAFFSFFCLLCALHVFWFFRNRFSLFIILVFSIILAGTKISYTLSVLPAIFPTLIGAIIWFPKPFVLLRYVVRVILILLVVSILFMVFLYRTPGNERRANCYHFIFASTIPLLSPDAGKIFLQEIGLPPSLTRLAGKSAYELDSELEAEPLRSSLTRRVHLKSIYQLAYRHSPEFYQLIKLAFLRTGFYPRLQYPSLSDSTEIRALRWDFWSKIHGSYLHGPFYYGIVLCLILILGILVWKRGNFGWPLFYVLTAMGLTLASMLQVAISVMGNGLVDFVKHMYLGNLLLDAAFVLVVSGLAVTARNWWKGSEGRSMFWCYPLSQQAVWDFLKKIYGRGEKIRNLSFILMGIGMIILLVSLLADFIGIGAYPAFGKNQVIGAAIGLLVFIAGIIINRRYLQVSKK
jgi:hypothetical protein